MTPALANAAVDHMVLEVRADADAAERRQRLARLAAIDRLIAGEAFDEGPVTDRTPPIDVLAGAAPQPFTRPMMGARAQVAQLDWDDAEERTLPSSRPPAMVAAPSSPRGLSRIAGAALRIGRALLRASRTRVS